MQKLKSKPIQLIFAIIGVMLIIYAFFPKGVLYNNVGIYAIALFGGLLVVNFGVINFLEFKFKNIVKTALSVVIGIAATVFFVASLLIYTVPEGLPGTGNYTLVVMGAKINGDEPGGTLRKRLDTAYEYLTENPKVKCIVSGGQGSDEETTEASVMKNYLVEKGIDKTRIFLEEKATSTKENIEYSFQVAKDNDLPEKFIICTDAFHQYRAALFCGEFEIPCYSLNAPITWKSEPVYLAREILALFYYFIL